MSVETLEFSEAIQHVQNSSKLLASSGSALYIVQDGKVVVEQYWGKHSNDVDARPIDASSQFHIASVRKSYIGFVAAHAISTGRIQSIDDFVTTYYKPDDSELFEGVTIRHLLTHTHGLRLVQGQLVREFPPGTGWAYRGIGVDTLTKLLEKVLETTIAAFLTKYVFEPFGLRETGWYAKEEEKLVSVLRDPEDASWYSGTSVTGNERNMYASVRDLANWGTLHLHKGKFQDKQRVSEAIIELVTSNQSPVELDATHPQNGCFWFVKEANGDLTEIGDRVPKGAYQILGYTGVTVLVIPEYRAVAVRAFNRFGSPEGYDYLEDVRSFGNTVSDCCRRSFITN